MSRFYNVWQKVEGTIEKDSIDIAYTVTWVKDLVSGKVDISDIDDVCVTVKGENDIYEEDPNYYLEHEAEVRSAVYSDAYKQGEPEFEDEYGVSYSQMLECFAEQERD